MHALLRQALSGVWAGHALYNLVTGIWPLLNIDLFQKVTGRKTDLWLVKTVGVVVSVIGVTIGAAGLRRQVTPEIAGLAIGTAAALATVDVTYVKKGRISKVYLLDALASSIFAAGWILAWRKKLLPGQ